MSSAATVDDAFEAERARLVGVAYRITGSRSDADDIVQDTWIRWASTEQAAIAEPAAWLTTVTSRLALDRLRSAQHRRETYVGPWLPEVATLAPGPEQRSELAESLTLGFLTMLERLAPVERVVFLLADVFSVPYDEIAGVVDKTPAACRQIASRARHRVQQDRPRYRPTDEEAWRVAEVLLAAVTEGDIEAVTALLSPEVVEVSDGGPDHRAARQPIVGPHRVARFVVNMARRVAEAGLDVQVEAINGQPGVIVWDRGQVHTALAVSVVEGRVDRIWVLVNPDKAATANLPAVI